MLFLIAAMSKNNVLGYKGRMPWHLPSDLQYFKKKTEGKPIIMGRATFESLPKILPNREHIVLTRNLNYFHPHITLCRNHEDLIKEYGGQKKDAFVIGGGQIYSTFLPFCTKLYITKIQAEFEGDTFFPEIPRVSEMNETNMNTFKLKNVSTMHRENGLDFVFEVYEAED